MIDYQRKGEDLIIRIHNEQPLRDFCDSLYLKNIDKYIREGILRVDKKQIDTNYILQKNDVIRLKAFIDKDDEVVPSNHTPRIIYEDDFLLIVDKKSGMLVHSDGATDKPVLASDVKYYYILNDIHTPVRPLHRLDEETSGLVIFSKSTLLQPYFDKLLQEKKIKREYYAFVDGYYRKGQKFVVDAPIGRDRHNAKKMRVSESGKSAKTNCICLESSRENNCSFVSCELESGRTHQIRVHLKHHKHPIISDSLYGTRYEYVDRLALQAYKVTIDSILYDEPLIISIPLANDLRKGFKTVLKLNK